MNTEETQQALSSVQTLIYDGQFDTALERLSGIELKAPSNSRADVLYMKAVCERYTKRFENAHQTLNTLLQEVPEFGRAYQELGHLLHSYGKTEEALSAYEQACFYNPALEASWQLQARLLTETGRKDRAQQALAQADRLKKLPKHLVAVTNYLYEGKLLKAETLCRNYLQKNTKDAEAMRLLAEIGRRLGSLEEAAFLLESALAFEPDNVQVRLDYIQVLRQQQRFAQALGQAETLYKTDKENPTFQSCYAIEALQANEIQIAFNMFDKVLEKLPSDPITLTSKGHALKTIGKQAEAIASYRAAYTAKPDHGDAYYSLANLKTYRFSDEEIAQMESQEASPQIPHHARLQLCFALGKAFEDRADYEQSFAYYQRGNDLKRAQNKYDPDQMEEELKAQKDICTSDLFKKHAGAGCSNPAPIFIVGLPRAGSTLLEQILASHSQVDGTLELPNILSLSHRLRDRQKVSANTSYPKVLHHLSMDQFMKLGDAYIQDTLVHRSGAPFFTDKMPNNFRHIALIHLILPNAKIIDARRNPMACCFSGFKQLFAEGQEFTYGLDLIGRYYRSYVDLMDHWHEVLPGKILHVQYENVVADLETEVRRILDFCHLPFEEDCINFHKTQRSVRTASSEQVRQPIYTKSLEQWQHYQEYLGPLKEALGPLARE